MHRPAAFSAGAFNRQATEGIAADASVLVSKIAHAKAQMMRQGR
jgi:hypothetical protein